MTDAGGTEIGFPSADFPGPTAFRVRMPAGWHGFAVPDAHLAVGADDPVARVRPSVVVNVHRIARSSSPELDLAVFVATDDALPGLEVLSDEIRAGLPVARRRMLRHHGPENVAVVTWRLLVLVDVGDRLADVVSAVGTAAAEAPEHVHGVVQRVVDSLRVATRPGR